MTTGRQSTRSRNWGTFLSPDVSLLPGGRFTLYCKLSIGKRALGMHLLLSFAASSKVAGSASLSVQHDKAAMVCLSCFLLTEVGTTERPEQKEHGK